MSTRPCFILFVTDHHRADHSGCYGNAIVRTPNIDAIAAAVRSRLFETMVGCMIALQDQSPAATGRA